jgi:methylmalonyl-CoA/ethylmalonyl-CoA epimerase
MTSAGPFIPAGGIAGRIRKLDHVGIATTDMAQAAAFFAGVLGATLLAGGDNDSTGIRLMQFSCGGFKIELMQSIRDDSILASRLANRGPGFHHMTFMVDDLVQTISDLETAGIETLGTNLASVNWRESFLPPQLTSGALVQLVDSARRWDVPATSYSIDDVLDGRVVWRDYVDCLRSPSAAG